MGRGAEIDLLYNAVLNGPAVQITRYPTLAAGSALTASGMTTGVYAYRAAGATQVQTIAAGTNTAGMWIAGGSLRNPSAIGTAFILWVGRGTAGAAVRATELEWDAILLAGAAAGAMGIPLANTIMVPIPLFVRAGIGICLDLASGSAAADDTANGAAFVYTGLGA